MEPMVLDLSWKKRFDLNVSRKKNLKMDLNSFFFKTMLLFLKMGGKRLILVWKHHHAAQMDDVTVV